MAHPCVFQGRGCLICHIRSVVGIRCTRPRNPFNPQPLIYHLTNNNDVLLFPLKAEEDREKRGPLSAYPDRPCPNPSYPHPHEFSHRSPLLITHHPRPSFPLPAPAPTRSAFSYTYELPLPTHPFAGPLVSSTYELLFQQPLCFEKHLRCPIVFSALSQNSASFANSVVKNSLTPFLTYCCKLFVVAKNIKSFGIKQIRTLSAKHPGWGIPSGKTGTGVPCPYGRKAVGTGQDLRVL